MEENNKYYTPEIEEFHVGFNIEFFDVIKFDKNTRKHEFGWTKQTIDAQWLEIYSRRYHINPEDIKGNVRVKYLDQSDIEELGWKLVKDYEEDKYFQIIKEEAFHYELDWDTYENLITIEFWEDTLNNTSNGYTLFKGKIKNKSELQRLMKQLNII